MLRPGGRCRPAAPASEIQAPALAGAQDNHRVACTPRSSAGRAARPALPAPRLRLAAVAAAEGRRPRAPSPASSAPPPQPALPSPPPVRLPLLTFSCARLSRF